LISDLFGAQFWLSSKTSYFETEEVALHVLFSL